MGRKPTAKAPVRGSLITSARWVSNVDDAMRDYVQRRKLGKGQPPQRDEIFGDRIRVKLTSGGPYITGTPLEVGAPRFTTVSREKSWHSAAVRSSHRPIGILLEPVKVNKYAWLQLSGVCPAYVDVGDVDHTHAYCAASGTTLTSGFGGPFELVSTPPGTGSRVLLVRFQPLLRRRILTNEAILVNDFGDCNFYGGSTLGTILGTADVYFNWMTGGMTEIPSGAHGWATWDDGICAWILDSSECTV